MVKGYGDDGAGSVWHDPPAGRGGPRAVRLALGAALVGACLLTGMPGRDAPWLMGDEQIFIADNPEVTGAGLEGSFWRQIALIFRFPPAEDLYQPVPILSYALEWSAVQAFSPAGEASGTAAGLVRLDDVLLHAANSLLLWWVLAWLLWGWGGMRGFTGKEPVGGGEAGEVSLAGVLSWGLALLWAVHPVNVQTWAADMGRTHLLSAFFALLALGLHVRALAPGRGWLFVAALAALLAAMLSKALVGWFVLVFVLEGVLLGWRRALRSPRVYAVTVLCVAFAALTWWTSRRSGLVEEAAAGLFGDPVARSALAVWIYARNILAPLWLSPWYLPDPQTGWGNVLVWAGLLLALASAAHFVWAVRRPERRLVALGWAWWWALLLPVLGVVGAREAAAVDRYLYQPLMGLALVGGAEVVRRSAARRAAVAAGMRGGTAPPAGIDEAGSGIAGGRVRRASRLTGVVCAGLAVVLAVLALPHVLLQRSTVQRFTRVAALNPGDPRAREGLAAAYNFATINPVPLQDLAEVGPDPDGGRAAGRVPGRQEQYFHFLARFKVTLAQAAETENLEYYFPTARDRAGFHRRLASSLALAREYEQSRVQAELARELEPDAYLTWVRLAHAYQGLGRWEEAAAGLERAEALLPDDLPAEARAAHFTNYGYLLLFNRERADLAFPKFRAAVETGAARPEAEIGLARCEIRVGEGVRGYALVSKVLRADPNNALARLVLAEYHLRSEHWPEAAAAYASLIDAYPRGYSRFEWYYEALRGFESVCENTGRFDYATIAWDEAVRQHPEHRGLRSFRVWALALGGLEDPDEWIADLLAEDPDNPLGCLAAAVVDLRRGNVGQAVAAVRRARRGEPVAEAREWERLQKVLKILEQKNQVSPEAAIIRGAAHLVSGSPDAAAGVLKAYLNSSAGGDWRGLAEELLRECGYGTVPDPES